MYVVLASSLNASFMDSAASILLSKSFGMAIYKGAKNTFTKMFSTATSVGITILTSYEVRNMASIAFAVEQKISPQITMSKIIIDEK